MLFGILIAVVGLAVIAIAYYNRNQLSDRPRWRVLLPYLASVVVVLGAGVVVVAATDQPTVGPAARALPP